MHSVVKPGEPRTICRWRSRYPRMRRRYPSWYTRSRKPRLGAVGGRKVVNIHHIITQQRDGTYLEAFLFANRGSVVCSNTHCTKAERGDIGVANLAGGERHYVSGL